MFIIKHRQQFVNLFFLFFLKKFVFEDSLRREGIYRIMTGKKQKGYGEAVDIK